jgi:hypothetical protein
MTSLTALWLPILISAAIVFAASSVLHMFTPWHKDDFRSVPNEDRVMDALRPFGIAPGDYMLPRASSMEEMRSPAYAEKMKKGPVLIATVLPGGMAGMGKQLVQWFVFVVIVGIVAGYVAGRALAPGTDYLHVFRFVGTTAFVTYSGAIWPLAIWYRRSLGTTIRSTIDGLLYGLLTAGTFGWLWPH